MTPEEKNEIVQAVITALGEYGNKYVTINIDCTNVTVKQQGKPTLPPDEPPGVQGN